MKKFFADCRRWRLAALGWPQLLPQLPAATFGVLINIWGSFEICVLTITVYLKKLALCNTIC
jgi:hypothetical protein